jgi:Ubiquitin carboxyl-terminal hydrolase, family 1
MARRRGCLENVGQVGDSGANALFCASSVSQCSARRHVKRTNWALPNRRINNACASLALANAVLNIESPDVDIGQELSNLKAFSADLDPDTRGHVISNSEKLRGGTSTRYAVVIVDAIPKKRNIVHNSFARASPFDDLEEMRPATKDEEYVGGLYLIATPLTSAIVSITSSLIFLLETTCASKEYN